MHIPAYLRVIMWVEVSIFFVGSILWVHKLSVWWNYFVSCHLVNRKRKWLYHIACGVRVQSSEHIWTFFFNWRIMHLFVLCPKLFLLCKIIISSELFLNTCICETSTDHQIYTAEMGYLPMQLSIKHCLFIGSFWANRLLLMKILESVTVIWVQVEGLLCIITDVILLTRCLYLLILYLRRGYLRCLDYARRAGSLLLRHLNLKVLLLIARSLNDRIGKNLTITAPKCLF